jgi:7-carboxy-7-deazaguanine synthase
MSTNLNDIYDLSLNVNEIFYSVQGEGSRTGLPCVFVRLQGCNLRCDWCDTPYALEMHETAEIMNFSEIIAKVESYNCSFVLFTGGEPLTQPDCIPLMKLLAEKGYTVAVETNGNMDLSKIDPLIVKIVDIKCPGSKMSKFMNYNNIEYLTKRDEVKFVIGDRIDYEFAVSIIDKYNLYSRCGEVLFSPVFGNIYLKELAEWILEDRLKVRLQLQVHKYIWGPNVRGV